jgi:hypothetical protein
MAVTEHIWIVRDLQGRWEIAWSEDAAEVYRGLGCEVDGPYVRANAEGAVGEIERLRDALDTIASGHAFGPREVARVALGLPATPTGDQW